MPTILRFLDHEAHRGAHLEDCRSTQQPDSVAHAGDAEGGRRRSEFRLALLQATNTCKNALPACAGGKYDLMPSPRRAEAPPRYNAVNFGRINRHDGPEDGLLADRCLTGGLPEFGSAFGGSEGPSPGGMPPGRGQHGGREDLPLDLDRRPAMVRRRSSTGKRGLDAKASA
jgi:hypothetical protein